ncbi:MAG: LCP family protein [Anaerolineales bacterium]|nr:LCP family protein [Anaerolineales bacterium]
MPDTLAAWVRRLTPPTGRTAAARRFGVVALAALLSACAIAHASAPTPATPLPTADARGGQFDSGDAARPSTTPPPADPGGTAAPSQDLEQPSPVTLIPSGSTATLAPPQAPASATPTAQDKPAPTLGAFSITPAAGATLVTPNATAVTPLEVADAVVNVLLIGTDYRATDSTFRTDTLIVASINKAAGTVSLLSVPRDLFVYVPMWGMTRINRAYGAGETNGYPGGGPALLEQTILYNLGIPIHYYALVNFDGFRQIVDTLGGVEVPVTCQLTEYKLLDPHLDERLPENYALYTQPAGVTHMDGALALWYARARPVGGDFFRGYRQRQVLRAMYHKAQSAGVLPQIPALYADFQDVVESDMGLWDIMQFVPLATRMDDAAIRSLNIGPNQTTGWTTPGGEAVLLPKPDALRALVTDFLADPATNRLARDLTWVRIVNAAPGMIDPRLAAETLRGDGFGVLLGDDDAMSQTETMLIDHSTSSKGSPVARLKALLHLSDAQVLADPDAGSPAQFEVILGSDYNACPRLDWMDTAHSDTTPTPAP